MQKVARFLYCSVLIAGCSGAVGSDTVRHRNRSQTSVADAGPVGGDGGVGEDGGAGGDAGAAIAPTPMGHDACGNGFDDDGNGEIDEGCACETGTTQPCHPDATVAGVGACAWGQQTCSGGEFGTWAECNGAGLAATEDCHDGVDNDCDGLLDCTDEVDCGCACAPPPDPTTLIDVLGGYSTVESCGPGCADLWVGRIGDNYWSGRCSIFEESTSISVLVPGAIRSAVLERAKWDDYMRVSLNGVRVWSGPDGNFPPETSGACELFTSWDTNPDVDLTSQFAAGGEIRFLIRVSVAGEGEGYARIRIHYDPVVLAGTPGCATP
jgi:hypothetical protein